MRKARSPAERGFTDHDRRRLATALHQAQDVRVYQRVQAVLLIAQGYSVDSAAYGRLSIFCFLERIIIERTG